MSQRVMVYIIAWVATLDNSGAGPVLSQEWIDVTDGGSAKVEEFKASIVSPHKGVVSQYHVYFEDGGHARYNEREFLIQEKALGPAQPDKRPETLYPTPELV